MAPGNTNEREFLSKKQAGILVCFFLSPVLKMLLAIKIAKSQQGDIVNTVKGFRHRWEDCIRVQGRREQLGLIVMHLFKAYAHPYFSDFKINKNKELLRNFNQNCLIPKLFSLFFGLKSPQKLCSFVNKIKVWNVINLNYHNHSLYISCLELVL